MNAKILKLYESMPTTMLETVEHFFKVKKEKAERKRDWRALTHVSGRLAVIQLLLKERRQG